VSFWDVLADVSGSQYNLVLAAAKMLPAEDETAADDLPVLALRIKIGNHTAFTNVPLFGPNQPPYPVVVGDVSLDYSTLYTYLGNCELTCALVQPPGSTAAVKNVTLMFDIAPTISSL
jgi:hypothetical protein